ncbi:MAG: hypothetical protein JJE17_05935 [Peptostreptococcaceae bacterium]|nr:hypothetical protein [Peptostreptococcaceae bacterium]
MREVTTTRKLQHPPYSNFIGYLKENNIKAQEVADIIGKRAAAVTKNNNGYTDYSYPEVMKICEHFKISEDTFKPSNKFNYATEFEKVLKDLFRINYIEENGHEPINLEEEYQTQKKRMDTKQEERKKENQSAYFERKMVEKEARDEKEKNASEEYKLIDKQIYPGEAIDVLKEIQDIDGTTDTTWIMAKAFLYGLAVGVRKERSKKAKVV